MVRCQGIYTQSFCEDGLDWLTPSSSRGMCPWSAMLRSRSQPWLWGWQALSIDRWGGQAGRGGKAILLTWNDPTASGFHHPSLTVLLKAFTGSLELLGLGTGALLQAEPSLTCTPGQVFMQTEHSPLPPSWQGPGSRWRWPVLLPIKLPNVMEILGGPKINIA